MGLRCSIKEKTEKGLRIKSRLARVGGSTLAHLVICCFTSEAQPQGPQRLQVNHEAFFHRKKRFPRPPNPPEPWSCKPSSGKGPTQFMERTTTPLHTHRGND